MTVTSELGEPIHKIATRGVRLWRDFDRLYFSKPRGPERTAAIQRDKATIIARLNADYQKPFFGCNRHGQVVELDAMTYLEVLTRMVRLMWVDPSKQQAALAAYARAGAPPPASIVSAEGEGRWVDPTYLERTVQFAARVEARFFARAEKLQREHLQRSAAATIPLLPTAEMFASRPLEACQRIADAYPDAQSQILCEEDLDFFLAICEGGGKPVNFIPIIDEGLAVWFKKDSLWYSEDLAAVPDLDADRVVILQGPVAVHHITTANEPASELLSKLLDGMLAKLVPAGPPASVLSLG
jgi:fatty acid synthase subunit beta